MRHCSNLACKTILSQYNKDKYCFMHKTELFLKGKSSAQTQLRAKSIQRYKEIMVNCLNCSQTKPRKVREQTKPVRIKFCSPECANKYYLKSTRAQRIGYAKSYYYTK